MKLYKVLNEDDRSCNGGTGRWTPGRWRSVRGDLVACKRGLHLTDAAHLPLWLGPVIWEAETDGDLIDAGDKWVARKARIVRRVEAWDERTARLFAADCAAHVLPIWEAERPDDDRPRRAIETARRYANGEATGDELTAAQAAAWDAAFAAAEAAARAAARAAAWDDARAAAWYAAWAAAEAAALDAELDWQARRLAEVLGLEVSR